MSTSNLPSLFTPKEMAQFTARANHARKQALAVPFLIIGVLMSLIVMSFVGYMEWHIAYQIFDYLAGDEGYWPATTMAFTGILMIIGFHVLAEHRPDSIAVRFVTVTASMLTPLYALGLGLLVTAILFSDGLGGMLESPESFTLGEVVQVLKSSWLDWAFEYITNPIAVLVFALAAGGLAVVNLYISHTMLSDVRKDIQNASKSTNLYRETRRDYTEVKAAQAEYQSITTQRQAIARINTEHLAMEIATETHAVIQEALTPHKCILKEIEYGAEPERFKPMVSAPPNPKQLSKDIQAIDAIGIEEILATLTIHSK